MSTAHRSRSDAARERPAADGARDTGAGREPDQELRIVAELRARADAVRLQEPARSGIADRLRAELGIAPEQREPSRPPTPAPRARARSTSKPAQPAAPSRPKRGGVRHRAGIAVSAGLCLLLVLGAMSLVASRNALPGQPFYGVKRGLENASLQLTGDETARARKRLDLAASRIAELATLSTRPTQAGTLRALFADFDGEAAGGARAMTAIGTNGSASALSELDGWARRTSARLDRLRPRLPDAVQAHAAHSGTVLTRIRSRVTALTARLGCASITSGEADALGALPATVPCSGSTRQAAPTPGATRAPAPERRRGVAGSVPPAPSAVPRSPRPAAPSPPPHPDPARPAAPAPAPAPDTGVPAPRPPVTSAPVPAPPTAPPAHHPSPAPPTPRRPPKVGDVLGGAGDVLGR